MDTPMRDLNYSTILQLVQRWLLAPISSKPFITGSAIMMKYGNAEPISFRKRLHSSSLKNKGSSSTPLLLLYVYACTLQSFTEKPLQVNFPHKEPETAN
ncbi:hypothetical protein CEXT_735751 [Caerostris extrusa]|uniref:Uncharacterized protein n=1 Tax=Caerostris extrusa TaxID=172846 RepID=A0AAV4P0W6_CAEEX|nr:hypothetical protein CEXT_735751 [Caerostris extrusa]